MADKMVDHFPDLGMIRGGQGPKQDPHRTREFHVEQRCQAITVRHLLKAESVQVGDAPPMPETETRQVMKDVSMRNYENHTHRNWDVRYLNDDTTAVLMRSRTSNHGWWQKGVVRVTGEWDWASIEAEQDKGESQPLPLTPVAKRQRGGVALAT